MLDNFAVEPGSVASLTLLAESQISLIHGILSSNLFLISLFWLALRPLSEAILSTSQRQPTSVFYGDARCGGSSQALCEMFRHNGAIP
jgi:hypothetical protein